jgi:hypothetical protein
VFNDDQYLQCVFAYKGTKIKVSRLHRVSPIIHKMHLIFLLFLLLLLLFFDWATYDTNSKRQWKFVAQIHVFMHVEVHIEPPRCLEAGFDVPHGIILII